MNQVRHSRGNDIKMECSQSIRLLVLIFMVMLNFCEPTEVTNILAVGDSMTSYMGGLLESFCADSNVENAGIGGTTAEQWSEMTADDISGCGTTAWDVVYISVGGNDLLESGCTLSATELTTRMENAVTNIVNNVAPGASKYVMTGYCMPHTPEGDGGGCSSPSDFAPLSEALRAVSADNVGLPPGAPTLEIIDSIAVCGGSLSSFSSEVYFQDPIHLNARGYCEVFSQSSVQEALTCSSVFEIDCDSLSDTEIPGLDGNCLSSGDSGDSSDSSDTFYTMSKAVSMSVVTISIFLQFFYF